MFIWALFLVRICWGNSGCLQGFWNWLKGHILKWNGFCDSESHLRPLMLKFAFLSRYFFVPHQSLHVFKVWHGREGKKLSPHCLVRMLWMWAVMRRKPWEASGLKAQVCSTSALLNLMVSRKEQSRYNKRLQKDG